ncbi:MAG TPA: hypothetical protein VLZ72_05755 [Flavobacterium sp.]|nr:hypothetical protein [Flavobacterium sp.]
MKQIDINKHTKYSLELIFSEADKMSNQLLKSLSENVNKSFILFAFFSSLFSYSFLKVVQSDFLYITLLIGSIVGCVVIRKNLFPFVINFNGALPEKMLDPYFDEFEGETLEKEYLATQIQSYNSAMNLNEQTIKKMVKRFNNSILVVIASFVLFGIVYFYLFIKCL